MKASTIDWNGVLKISSSSSSLDNSDVDIESGEKFEKFFSIISFECEDNSVLAYDSNIR